MAKREIKIMSERDLDKIPEEKVGKVLAGYRDRLLKAARNERLRGIIFERRDEIAALLEARGEGAFTDEVTMFRGLEDPDALGWYTPMRTRPERDESEFEYRRPGFYVLGRERITWEQAGDIRANNRTPYKVGNPIQVSFADLFRLEGVKNDNKPIYITDPPTPELLQLLAAVLLYRPDFEDRIFWLNWQDDGQLTITPLKDGAPIPLSVASSDETALALRSTQLELVGSDVDTARSIHRILNHIPRPEEVYEGRVSKIADFGMFVEILPGVEGLVHKSEIFNYRDEDWRSRFQEGDRVKVVVTEVEGRIDCLRIRLSMRNTEDLEPTFARAELEVVEPLLLEDESRIIEGRFEEAGDDGDGESTG